MTDDKQFSLPDIVGTCSLWMNCSIVILGSSYVSKELRD